VNLEEHAAVLALLADGEAWSSSALALALGTSQRSVQRAPEELAAEDRVKSFRLERARRWVAELQFAGRIGSRIIEEIPNADRKGEVVRRHEGLWLHRAR
jgi:hypothetical protein